MKKCRWGTCLGFPPRSQSFAFEPDGSVRSICSLSGLATSLHRPCGNPLNPRKGALRPTHTIKSI